MIYFLLMMKRKINKNLIHLKNTFENPNYIGAVLEGSSRSGKTISSIDFIIWLCSSKSNLTINCVRETYNGFKTTLYLDFHKRLKDFGLASPFDDSKEVSSFKIFDNQINFIGADKPSKFEGAGADIWYFNEMLDIENIMFNLAEQRCRVFWWGDYNPKAVNHWVFDRILKRSDIAYCHSTFNDNPFISHIERNKILSYEPTPYNIDQGTADKYMWSVYGLGERATSDQIIFKNWDEFTDPPKEYDLKIYGVDFGFTNDPSTLVEVYIDKKNIWAKQLLYQTGLTNQELAEKITPMLDNNYYVICDSAEPKSIRELRLCNINAIACKKGADSIIHGINFMKSKQIHIHKDSIELKKEFRSYSFAKDRQGNTLNIPIGGADHVIDSLRYASTFFYI